MTRIHDVLQLLYQKQKGNQWTGHPLDIVAGWNAWAAECPCYFVLIWPAGSSALCIQQTLLRACRDQQSCRNTVIAGCCDLYMSRAKWPRSPESPVTLICPRSAPLDTVTFSLLTPLYFVSALSNLCSLFLSKGTSAATSHVFIIQVLYIEVIQFKQAFHFIYLHINSTS